MREVTHRSKNLLAVLQGIVRQTARRTKDLDEFISSFSARLQSIAHSHDLLVNDNWSGTSLRALIERQIGIFSDLDTGRIRIDGADISITAVAVQNLGLAFHELATNALKYGSLSMPEGLVQVGWQIDTASKREQEAASGGELRLIWQETGGPIVKQLGETGFGRVLLEQVVGRALDGIVTLDFAPSGVICTMRLPLSRAAALEALPQTADIAPVTEKA
ncbi:MAG: sensor histidine kinase [Rhodomicrobium sp.]|nr:sensor histidine kinase [Rhodomicrobium sp.]